MKYLPYKINHSEIDKKLMKTILIKTRILLILDEAIAFLPNKSHIKKKKKKKNQTFIIINSTIYVSNDGIKLFLKAVLLSKLYLFWQGGGYRTLKICIR